MGQRYITAKTLPGTCSYHNFTPASNIKIGTKIVSEQLEYSFVFNFQTDEIIFKMPVYEYELQSV